MGIRDGTESGKIYVLQHRRTKMYATERKGKSRGMYWGLYIGKPGGKRYSAIRFEGGDDLNAKLALSGNQDLIPIEVKA